ncbi:MAG: hypothetical protein LKK19_04440 [Bacteroidales bacterium]|nr:hypothetical protein [Bacteroidales bacterium]MCI2121931.1 hypothetical protein [Bacteroidales bacterium]MCI2145462.1 hypothetical protein [Bacteroidales bacterium]
MKPKTLRGIQLFWSYFIGIGALAGALGMFCSFAGMEGMLPPMREKLPMFDVMLRNLTWPGVALLCANCIPNAVAIVLIHGNKAAGKWMSLACGIILMLWISVEFYIFGFPALCIIYMAFGVLQTLGAILWIRSLRRSALV